MQHQTAAIIVWAVIYGVILYFAGGHLDERCYEILGTERMRVCYEAYSKSGDRVMLIIRALYFGVFGVLATGLLGEYTISIAAIWTAIPLILILFCEGCFIVWELMSEETRKRFLRDFDEVHSQFGVEGN